MTERPARAQFLQTALLVAAVAVWPATGCRLSSAGGETVLRLWAMGREGEVVTQLLPDFERTHPGIRVLVQQLPWTAAHEKLLTAFAGDATPDVCQLGNTWIPEFVAVGALERLDRYADTSSVVQPADYFAGIWDTNRVGGGLYGIPWYVDTRLLFYRRDILERAGFSSPPVSWPELTAALAAIKARAAPDRYAILLPLNDVDPLLAFALQQDDPLLRDDGQWGNFESAGFRTAMSFYMQMFQRGWAPPLADREVSNVWTEFGRGNFAFYISGPWNIGELKRRLPPGEQSTWATAPLPGPTGPGASIAGGSSLVIFRASRHKAASWQLVEYFSRPDIQKKFHELTGDLPPRRATWSDPALADDVHAHAFREQLERVKPLPKVPEWERIANEVRLVTERAVHGQLSVEQAGRVLDAQADRILEKRRWMLARGRAG